MCNPARSSCFMPMAAAGTPKAPSPQSSPRSSRAVIRSRRCRSFSRRASCHIGDLLQLAAGRHRSFAATGRGRHSRRRTHQFPLALAWRRANSAGIERPALTSRCIRDAHVSLDPDVRGHRQHNATVHRARRACSYRQHGGWRAGTGVLPGRSARHRPRAAGRCGDDAAGRPQAFRRPCRSRPGRSCSRSTMARSPGRPVACSMRSSANARGHRSSCWGAMCLRTRSLPAASCARAGGSTGVFARVDRDVSI